MHSHVHSHVHSGCSHHHVTTRSVRLLGFSFAINIVLTVVELIAGIFAGSVALIGDA